MNFVDSSEHFVHHNLIRHDIIVYTTKKEIKKNTATQVRQVKSE